MKHRLVVIGNGMAGMRTIEELLSANPERYSITVFGAEPYGNYNRVMLSAVLSGEKRIEDIVINDRQWYREHNICLHAGVEKTVIHLDRGLHKVYAKDGTVAEYDRLLIATGSKPVLPDIPGCQLHGVISFRDMVDVNKILAYCATPRKAVVLGGGLLGLEAASGLAMNGMAVTVIHTRDTLLNRQLDQQAGKLLQAELEARGIKFIMSAQTKALLGDEHNHVRAVQLYDDCKLECDLFVLAIGVVPNMALAKQAGLYCEKGIVVNDTLQSYDPSVYAVGECIQHRGNTFGLVAPLFEQAKVCANHLSCHGVAEYITLPTATKLKVSGIKLFSLGDIIGSENTTAICFSDPELKVYKKLILQDNTITGVVLYGDTSDGIWFQELLESKVNIATMRATLMFGKAALKQDKLVA